KRPEDDDALGLLGWVDDRRRPALDQALALRAPALLARGGVDREQERALLLVAEKNQRAAGQDRRAGHAVEVDERSERELPALLALGIEGHEPELGEERVHVLA